MSQLSVPVNRVAQNSEQSSLADCAGFGVSRIAIVLLVIIATINAWGFHLRQRTWTATRQLADLESRWAVLSSHVGEAKEVRPRIEAMLTQLQAMKEDRDAPASVLPLLESLAAAIPPQITLAGFQTSTQPDNPGDYGLRVDGVIDGQDAAASVERMRQGLHSVLEARFSDSELSAACERIEEIGAGSANEGKRVFTIAATVRPKSRVPQTIEP
jgi:hypothetical protein